MDQKYYKVRRLLMVLMFIFILSTGSTVLWAAEKFPERPIEFICTWGAGGGADQMARTLSRVSEKFLGVPIRVSNVSGYSGNRGLADLVSGKADGHTVATYIADTLATISADTSPYRVSHFEWIIRTQVAPSFLFVKEGGPFKTVQDLLKYAKDNPGKLRVGATGLGTVDDITVRYLASKGYKMLLIPLPKPEERYASTLSGQSDVLYEQAGDIKQYLVSKQLRPVVIFARKRHRDFPEVPSSTEMGFDLTLPQFRSIVAKAGTPADRVKILAEAFRKGMETPEWKRFADDQYLDPESYMGPDKLSEWVASEMETMRNFMKTFGMVK
ncbi:MAG: tripartite tricarboxylate transporter substrate binding protein [Syntrophaceae bacterium]|nr:tripartite tricarboxylate transporter substrate binding protein [Syntrophaceae bacterium]